MVGNDAKKIGVVYACVTGGYDELINHAYVNPDWDYVCFTNNIGIANIKNSTWKIMPLVFDKLDNVRNNRWHKLHPHCLFPEYKYSLYLDANIDILKSDFFDDINKAIAEKRKLSIAPHPERNCIYDELAACIRLGKDDEAVMKKQVELFRQDGFPEKQGLFENGMMFREHNDKEVVAVMEDWWWWVKNYSRRDQLSLMYVLWKHKMKVLPLSEISYRHSDKVAFDYGKRHVTKEELLVQEKIK